MKEKCLDVDHRHETKDFTVGPQNLRLVLGALLHLVSVALFDLEIDRHQHTFHHYHRAQKIRQCTVEAEKYGTPMKRL